MKKGNCPKCGSKHIRANVGVRLSYEGGSLILAMKREVKAGPFSLPGLVTTDLQAWVCGECGYTELIAERPNELWKGVSSGTPA